MLSSRQIPFSASMRAMSSSPTRGPTRVCWIELETTRMLDFNNASPVSCALRKYSSSRTTRFSGVAVLIWPMTTCLTKSWRTNASASTRLAVRRVRRMSLRKPKRTRSLDQSQTGAPVEHHRDDQQAIEYRAKIIGLDRRDGGNGIGDQRGSEQDDGVAQRGATRALTSVSGAQACEDRMS